MKDNQLFLTLTSLVLFGFPPFFIVFFRSKTLEQRKAIHGAIVIAVVLTCKFFVELDFYKFFSLSLLLPFFAFASGFLLIGWYISGAMVGFKTWVITGKWPTIFSNDKR